ncbi:GNS1/SUR4 family-domain-containing protein [Aspergillus pseudotamarii]|uniref:Elongation of fatty acids protein n=1 Tax=Aspergillus pseudotamarii TaxID=132259 RepID=A0A5N6SZE6_ASPPS|nr:GNS1/SUR4 family-domain-containing protein [Aspergillus pseudotamarii]KAE8139110.1 GNS1/SUR4 family-domain-containing protein [Aspergillus pseudotamarii]
MSVHFGFPPSSLFILDQAQIKLTIPTHQLAKFGISTAFYTITLHLRVSLVAIFIYTTVVLLLNDMDRRRHGMPWAINHMRRHDTFYTVLVEGLFCRGGQITSYMSKFYEVIDTAIILAKGRQASLHHIYHHAGVILVSWALVRFEYPPALILFFLTAGVHALKVSSNKYTYYALISIHVAVPQSAKAVMTVIQIVQFFIDLIVCPSYLFVFYDIPLHYARCTDYREMGDTLDTRASRDAGTNGQSYCDIRTVGCMNKSHTSVAWLGIIFILSLTWMFLQFFRSTYLQAAKKKTP